MPRSIITPMDEVTGSFGSGLRWWRERRGFSQLDLAGAAETTQRHLSFLKSGRASPSAFQGHPLPSCSHTTPKHPERGDTKQ